MPDGPCLYPQQFLNLLVSQLPVYSPTILSDVRPTDGLLGHISTGQWDPFSGLTQTQDRFRNVMPNTTKKWETLSEASCEGAPCDPTEHEICWGYDRLTFSQERQSWKSQMLCIDQIMSATKAVEHIEQIVSEILRPATSFIGSAYVRKKNLDLSGRKILANASMSSFTWAWNAVGDAEVFATPSAFPTSKLTPEMLQRQFTPLMYNGYFGKWTNDPFWGEYSQHAELLTDMDTAWDLDKLATNQRISDLWRFQHWDAAHEYYKYGMGGKIGNYMVHIDPFAMRFNRKGNQLQLVLPYKNDAATVGLGSEVNDDYANAKYQISTIHHRFSWMLKVAQMQSINAAMPLMVRGLNGQWNFAIDNLGSDCDGKAIANYRRNKGFFYSDFRWGAQPLHTEWETSILHLREPKVIYVVAPCDTDLTSYPVQNYNSACDGCDTIYRWEPDANDDDAFVLAAATVMCDSEPVDNGAINSATLAALVIALNGDAATGALGTWSADGTDLILSGATCKPSLPWVV